MTTVNQTVSKNLRRSIFEKNQPASDGLLQQNQLWRRAVPHHPNDVDTISETLQRSIVQMVSAAALFIGCLVMMFRTNWIMAVTAIAASLIGFAFVTIVTKSSQKYFIARQEWLGKINGHIEEVYSGHSIVRLYNARSSKVTLLTE